MYIRGLNRGKYKEMGYALFAQRKIVLDGQLNNLQLQQTQRSNEQFALATQTAGLQQELSSMQASQSTELSHEYEKLSKVGEGDGTNTPTAEEASQMRADINAGIEQLQAEFQAELDAINRRIYQVSIKENTVEMAVKNLDTEVTAIEKQLEAVEEAEGQGIDNATPKFNGIS